MRIKYWMGYNVGIQNVRSYALLPLTEPALALSSFSIPLEQKQMGRFEAALIEHLNPSLAAHTTAYGYPLSRSPPAVAVFAQRMRQMQPPVLQGWLRRMRTTVAHGQAPYYLQPDYLDAVLSPRNRAADSYIHSQRFGDPLMSSRLQTVNLVLADPF